MSRSRLASRVMPRHRYTRRRLVDIPIQLTKQTFVEYEHVHLAMSKALYTPFDLHVAKRMAREDW